MDKSEQQQSTRSYSPSSLSSSSSSSINNQQFEIEPNTLVVVDKLLIVGKANDFCHQIENDESWAKFQRAENRLFEESRLFGYQNCFR